jgi:hypothetical protein
VPELPDHLIAQIAVQVRARLATCPPDLSRYEGSVVVGMLLDTPPPESIKSACDNCQETITLGPDTQALMARYPGLRALCHICALALQALNVANGGATSSVHRAAKVLRRPWLN